MGDRKLQCLFLGFEALVTQKLLILLLFILFNILSPLNLIRFVDAADDSEWNVCTLEGLLSLSENAVNTIEPPFKTVQHVIIKNSCLPESDFVRCWRLQLP